MQTTETKRDAIQKFIDHESGLYKDWIIRPIEEGVHTVVVLEAFRDDKVSEKPEKTLHVSTSEIQVLDGELDEAAKIMIRKWLTSL